MCTRMAGTAGWLAVLFSFGERVKRTGPILLPARERRPVLDDVAHCPCHAFFVHVPTNVIVGADDIEVALLEAFDHEISGLFGRPGACRLLDSAMACQISEDESGNKEMCRHLRLAFSQMVLQGFGEDFHACF